MIILHTSGGRTGNQVLLLSNLIATALEHNLSFINVSFKSCSKFDIVHNSAMRNFYSRIIVSILWRLYFFKLCHPLLRLFGILFHTNTSSQPDSVSHFLINESKGKVIILNAWPYTDYSALYKHQHTVRQLLCPQKNIVARAREIINGILPDGCIAVGVHIRRTDYREWHNGKYFYEIDTYRSWMQRVSLISETPVYFVICSDEKFQKDEFAGIGAGTYISDNDYMVDLTLLAACDYIIGPPSTFASYASFWGQTPRYTIYQQSPELHSLEDFGISLIDYDDTYEKYEGDKLVSRMHIILKEGEIEKIKYIS